MVEGVGGVIAVVVVGVWGCCMCSGQCGLLKT